jgi:hypothetical protein
MQNGHLRRLQSLSHRFGIFCYPDRKIFNALHVAMTIKNDDETAEFSIMSELVQWTLDGDKTLTFLKLFPQKKPPLLC